MKASPPSAGASPSARKSSTSPWLAALSLALCLGACGGPPALRDTEGKGYGEAALAGRWLVVNYWATWCAPCLVEIPELNALSGSHARLLVFGVNFDNPQGQEAARQIARMGITFPVLAEDPHLRFGAQRPAVLPTTLIVSPSGALAATLVGPQTRESILAVIAASGGPAPP